MASQLDADDKQQTLDWAAARQAWDQHVEALDTDAGERADGVTALESKLGTRAHWDGVYERELRNFAEMMRALGYQRLVSVENFRSPNFPLVASTLYWMVQRYDPDIVMSDNIETEEARVHFLTKTAEALLNKANIKLNTKNLYMADGHAVRELLKVAKTLYAASEAQEAYKAGEELPDVPSLGTKSKDIRVARQLAADITDRGARLHDLLGHENDVKQDRQAALRFLDTISSNLDGGEHAHVRSCVETKILRRVRPPRHRRDRRTG